MIEEEIWKDLGDIKGLEEFKGYQVSTYGRVCSTRNKEIKILSQYISSGYKKVNLRIKVNKHKLISVHRLVALAFIPNPDPDNFKEINHIDENKLNNLVDNLEWCTRSYNLKYYHKLNPGTRAGELNCNNKYTEKEIIEIYNLLKQHELTIKEISVITNMSYNQIREIQTGTAWIYITSKLGGPLCSKQSRPKEENVVEIYNLLKQNELTQEEIALRFNVSKNTINNIQHGITWSNVIDKLGGPIYKYKKCSKVHNKAEIDSREN